MPSSEEPCWTYVGTSAARTMSSRRSRLLVRRTSLREVSGLSSASMPAAASSGSVSSKIRPLESARVITVESAKKKDFTAKNAKTAKENLIFHDVQKIPERFQRVRAPFCDSMNPLDARTELRELLLDALVPAIEVIDPVDSGLAFGNETRDDEARRGAQVGRHDGCALQLRNAAHDRRVSRDLDVGAETLHFQGMHEPVLEYGLGDDGGAFRYRVQRHQLRLHVGRERRIGSGPDIDRLGPPPHGERDRPVPRLQLPARLAQLFEHRIENARVRSVKSDLAAGRCGRREEG